MMHETLGIARPSQLLGYDSEDIIPSGGLGAVAAQAGLGKTALVVQLAMDAMLRGSQVMHVSLHDLVPKVHLRYEQLFQVIAAQASVLQREELWESLLRKRFIMTFVGDGFSVSKLRERLGDLISHKIFTPDMMIIDGLALQEDVRAMVGELKAMAQEHGMRIWMTVHTGSRDDQETGTMSSLLTEASHFFDAVFQLEPQAGSVSIKPLLGISETAPSVFLDPATLLIRGQIPGRG